MKIHEALVRNPRVATLANNGQARIGGEDDRARAVLREELSSFVFDGRFGDALQRILDRYLTSFGGAKQDSAWVSGFFGSGKSHLLKMTAHLWENTKFPDGAAARSLVVGLPPDVEAALRELDVKARQVGRRPLAAAGTLLGGNARVRRTVLDILLRACGWPGEFELGRFCFWLREEGCLAQVQAAVEASGGHWERELGNLYVSSVLAKAVVGALPEFAADAKDALGAFRSQFAPSKDDITTAQFVEVARKALANGRELPPTVLVLDEVQQYIGESSERSAAITEVAEALQTEFDGRVMLVGAGQSALSTDTPNLFRLRDRFVVRVELTDADVEVVTRKVLLQKPQNAVPEVEALLERSAGEVARHLRDTKIGPKPEDARVLVEDYPLLPVRRRFWEACFDAVDAGGAQAQLRSRLRILSDSLAELADRELGAVVPASDLFGAVAPDMVSGGVLLRELDTRIRGLDDGTSEGRLRRDVCGLAFLIGKLSRESGVDLGVRATAQTVADLMVDDVSRDASGFRRQVAEELDGLVARSVLLKVGDEYRLQTTEGAEWERAWREQVAALRQNEVEASRVRNQLLGAAVGKAVDSIRLIHGDSKNRRRLSLHAGEQSPSSAGADSSAITVWLRDGWSCREVEVERAAREAGAEDAMLFVFLPRRHADRLRQHTLGAAAARHVLETKGTPASAEGREARAGMKSRRSDEANRRDALVLEVLLTATVYQGGGAEVFGDDLAQKLERGAKASLARLFPEFDKADHRSWELALRQARDGSDTPFRVVGWDGPTAEHPVSREVLAAVGAGARGTAIQKKLKSAPWGWPQDAVDAVLIALHRSGHLLATRNGAEVTPGALDQAALKSAEFRREKVVLTTTQRLGIRGLFQQLGLPAKSGEEGRLAPGFLDALRELAAEAGGARPLPPVPDVTFIDDLSRQSGAEQLAALWDRREPVSESIAAWRALAERRRRREGAWQLAVALRRRARGLPAAEALEEEFRAMEQQRSLLAETDRLAPLSGRLAGLLRGELTARRKAHAAAVASATAELAEDATWRRLALDQQDEILRQTRLTPPPEPPIASPEELRAHLDERSLSAWRADTDATPERAAQALEEAARRVHEADDEPQPTSVTIRRGTLANESAVKDWLREQEKTLLEAVRKGPVILR